MNRNIRTKVFGAYVIVLALGAILAALVFLYGGEVREATRALAGRDVPELKAIAALQLNIVRHEAVLYEYYATRDRRRFLENYRAVETVCLEGFESIAESFARSDSAARARGEYETLRRAARALDGALRAGDAERARGALAQAAGAARTINRELDALARSVEARVAASGAAAESTVDRMQWHVIVLSGSIFVVSLFVGYYINAYIGEQAERRRLALFPERNPNPVLRLDAAGAVRYANPAAAALLAELGLEGDARALLPEDLAERLHALRRGPQVRDLWEYRVRERTLECGVHWIPDLAVFHAYVTDITQRKQAEEKLIYQAYHDALTGLPNRRMFEERIEHVLYSPERAGMRAAVLLMGLDRFKIIIDSLGHAVGDGLLRAVAARLAQLLEECREMCEGATLYRFEGDLFCVLLPGFRMSEMPVLFAERVIEGLRKPFYVIGRELFTTLSIGVSVFPLDGQDGPTLLKNADTAMHRAKARGGNGLQCYTRDMNDRAAEWLTLENHLRHAEELGELRLYYQPQVGVHSGRIAGMEALLRWQHPERGLLAPGVFIPLAEETGLIMPLGAWVLRSACAQAKAWRGGGLGPLTVAVNISARQFLHDLPRLVASALAETGLAGECLELEITETVAMQDVEHTIATLARLRELGVQLSVDDFGTGFSSLNYLKRFPIHKLKIDQSFVRNVTSDEDDAAITQAVIALGHSLDLKVIAEGVETAEQLALLRRWDCDEYQGYLYSNPLPPESFEALARTGIPRAADSLAL